jgi:hypothetical protein
VQIQGLRLERWNDRSFNKILSMSTAKKNFVKTCFLHRSLSPHVVKQCLFALGHRLQLSLRPSKSLYPSRASDLQHLWWTNPPVFTLTLDGAAASSPSTLEIFIRAVHTPQVTPAPPQRRSHYSSSSSGGATFALLSHRFLFATLSRRFARSESVNSNGFGLFE